MKKLSVVIPVFNEQRTIAELIRRVQETPLRVLEREIIIVDDCSTDGTREILKALEEKSLAAQTRHPPARTVVRAGSRYEREPARRCRILYQEKNQGKGAAVRRGFAEATGDFVIIQDADLEYDPHEYQFLLAPLLDGRADVVYGSRFTGHRPHRVLFFWHYLGNKFLTTLSNMLTNLNLTDMETCYKAFNQRALLAIRDDLQSNRFGIDPEITARVAKKKLRVYEIGISYSGRTYAEGKKIDWKDGVSVLWAIVKFNVFG